MVTETFPHALRLVLVDEGGLDDDPHDHGGRTAHGIIQREYDGYRVRHSLPKQDVWKITPAEYTEIYHDRYWMPWCDRLPPGLDYAFFDACVNAGPAQAARTLQRALKLRPDGNMGDVTLAAAMTRAEDDVEGLIHDFAEARRKFYRALAQYPRYGRGWMARVDHVEKAAEAMTSAPAESVVRNGLSDDLKASASARAKSEDVAQPPVTPEVASAGGIAAMAGGSLIAQIKGFSTELAAYVDVPMVKNILAAAAVACVILTVYGFLHRAQTARHAG